MVEAPAIALEETIVFIEKEEKILISKRPFKLAEEYWDTLGPGLTTGAADDDPSGLATYPQAGAMILVSHVPEFVAQIRVDEILDLEK